MAKLCKRLPREVLLPRWVQFTPPYGFLSARAGLRDSVPALGFWATIPTIPIIPRSRELALAIPKGDGEHGFVFTCSGSRELALAISAKANIPSLVLFGRVDHARASSAKRSSGKFWATSWTPSLFVKCSSCFVSRVSALSAFCLRNRRFQVRFPSSALPISPGKTP